MHEERFHPDLLDDDDPFETDVQLAHLFKHELLGCYEAADHLAVRYRQDRGIR